MNQFIGKQFDQYQIGPLLGEGGMGAVYHAHDLKNNRPVALKIMLATLTNKPHFRQRFQQEANICASFNSPSIVKIYGNGEVDGYPYIAMEYIEGGSLSNYVNQISWGGAGNILPLDEVLALSAQIAEGLAYAHQRGLVHRDIKPDNILLKLRDGATGSPRQAVISDFGLAVQLKTADDAATNPFMGSLAYMSPEQCENSGLDGRSDIYALGILLYELATGQLPFQINAPADIVKHINETPLPPRLINPQLPQPIEDIILRAIAKKPNERYQTAAEMAHALRQLAVDENLLTAVPQESQKAVTQWLENRWVASVNVQDRVDTSKTWTSDGRYRLFVTSQHEESQIHGLNKPIITIGRNADNDIVLEDRTVSAHHTSLSMSENGNGRVSGWLARDLGSTNGTYLGDRTLGFDEDVAWKDEDVLRIGPYHLKWQLFSGEEERIGELGAEIGIAALGVAAIAGSNSPSADPDSPIAQSAVSSSDNLSVAITPETAVLEPEIELPIDITITNTGITVQEVDIRLFDNSGSHPIWIQLQEHRVKLLPEESASLTAIANLPADFRMDAGKHPLNVQATSDRGESETAVITLVRPDSELFTLDIHPSNLQEDVLCRVTIRDESNFDNAYTIMGIDDADALLFDFGEPQHAILSDFDSNQQTIKVASQSEASTSFTIRPKKRPLFGNDKPFPFKVRVRTETADWQTLTGQVDIHSRISRRLVIFLMLLTMLFCLLGFGVYSMVAADKAEQQLANQTALNSVGATATAAQAEANQAFSEVENAQATANALTASGDEEGAANAQSTADALEFSANATQAAASALQDEIEALTEAIDATATPPPPPTSLTLDGDNVDENSPIGSTVGSFTASSVAFLNTNPASKSTGASRLFRANSQSDILFTYTIVGGDADAFFIDGDVLKTAVLFDFETKDSYEVTVLADNGFEGTIEADFAISVNDVSDTPQLSISGVAVDEGDGTAVLTVLMTGSTQSEVTVDYTTSDGTAIAGDDYEESGDTLTWAPGENGEREIEIALIDDDIKESAETFIVTLEKAVIAEIDDGEATVTINDDESAPTISIAAASAKEGDGEAIVIVTMTGKSSEDVTVAYTTKDGTASKASDYAEDDGEISWAAGEDGDIEIAVSFEDDEIDEPSESLSVVLSNATNATIASSTATVTIEDDDDAPVLTIEAAGPFAEDAGSIGLTISIEGSSSEAVEVSYATSDDTTTVGKDYKDTNGTIIWPAESTSAQAITIPILSDSIFEGEDEIFIVTLSAPVNATIKTAEERYAITDDDSEPSLAITDITVNENAGSAVLTVVMSGGSSTDVTVEYTTVDGTATVAGGDYGKTASPPVLTWPANEQDGSREISVVINNDDVDEGISETFLVNLLNNSANSIFLNNSATVTITDNDTAAITVDPTNATIGEPSTTASFKVSLGSRPTAAVTIPLSSSAPTQCTVPASVVINPSDWETGVNVTITPVNDDIAEDTLTCQVITGDPTSGDGIYDAFKATDVSDVTVTVNDEDIAGVLVTLPASLTISETTGSNTDQFTIKLRSQPANNASVTVPLRSLTTGQCTIAQSEVVILAANWNVAVPVVVTAVDENDIDNIPDNCEIDTGNPTSDDKKYDDFTASDIVNPIFTIANDDVPSAAVSPANLTITETTPAVGASFRVILSSKPKAAVTFTVTANNDCSVSSPSIEILPTNWNTGVPVTVTAADDAIEDGPTDCTISLGTAQSPPPTGDSDYHGVINPIPNAIAITVLDDDTTPVIGSGQTVTIDEDASAGDILAPALIIIDEDGDSSFISNIISVAPISGTDFFDFSGNNLRLTGDANLDYEMQRTYAIELTASDGTNTSTVETVTIGINDVDDEPPVVTVNSDLTVDEGATAIINNTMLDAEDVDTIQSSLIFSVTTAVANGRLQLSTPSGVPITTFTQDDLANGRVQYVHDGSETITDTFTFDVGDVSGNALAGQTFSITVIPVNDAPVANADSYTATEGITKIITTTVLSNDTDVDTATISLTAVSPTSPASGTLVLGSSGIFTYTSNTNTCGTDNFTYRANDNESINYLSAPATVTLNIICVDDPPTLATNVSLIAPEGLTTIITATYLSANDIDTADSGIVFTATTPAVGYLQLNPNTTAITTFTQADLAAGIVEYVHDGTEPTIAPTDSFTFTIGDGTTHNSVSGTFTITITEQPDPPTVITNTALTAPEGMTTAIFTSTLSARDSDSIDTDIVFAITTAPQNGRLQLSTTPGMTITTFTQANLAANEVQYVHDGTESPLTDSFDFTVSDGTTTLASQTFNINITPLNDPPTAVDDSFTVTEGFTLTVTIANSILDNDTDVDTVAISLTAVPSNTTPFGTLDLHSSGIFTYTTTDPDYCSTDSFTYRANDNESVNNLSDPATVTISINCVDDAPILITNTLLTAPEGMTTTITTTYLSASDVDTTDDNIDFQIITPQYGRLQLSTAPGVTITTFTQADLVAGIVQYVHDGTESPPASTDDFSFTIKDETSTLGIAQFDITITPVNDAPVAVTDSYTATEATDRIVTAANGVLDNDTDVDTAVVNLTAVISSTTISGTLDLHSSGAFTYTSNTNTCGTDSFTYRANDGGVENWLSDPAAVTITITCVDDPPTVVTSTLTAAEGVTTTITTAELNGTDIDSSDNAIDFTITTGLQRGFLQLSTNRGTAITTFTEADVVAGRVEYVHNGDDTPLTDSFIFSISDDTNTVTGKTFSITVTPVNDPPVANTDSYTATEGIARVIPAINGVLANDTDVDTAHIILTAVIDTPPSNSLAFTLNSNGSFSYQAATDYCGTDSFTYHADDGDASNIATVNLTINCVNNPPTTVNDTANATGTSNTNITVLDNDTDTETSPLDDYGEVTVTIPPLSGTTSINIGVGYIRYSATAAITGTDSFTYEICDDGDDGIGGGAGTLGIQCSTATVTINLTVASAEPTIFLAQADGCEEMDSCQLTPSGGRGRNDISKPFFVLGKQGSDGAITAVLTHQTLIPASDTVRLDLYISLQNADGSPNARAVLAETAVLLADGTLYPTTISQESGYTVIAVDSSDSMDGLLDRLRNATLSLVDGMSAGSNVAVIRYDENIDLIQPFSSDRAVINNALNSIQIEEDATCTYDAAYAAMQALVQTAPNNPNRTLVFVSDGVDRDANGNIPAACSDYTEAQAIAYATANNIVIHIIGSDGVDGLPIATLSGASGGTVSVINDQSPTVDGAMLTSFSSQWIVSAIMQPAQGLQRGAALPTLADGTTPSPVPVQFVSPRDYVVEETAVLPKTIDISNFRYDESRDQFQMDVALGDLTDVQILRVELLDGETNVQTGLSIITDPHFSQRVAISAAGLTGAQTSIAHAYALNNNSGMVRNDNGEPMEAFYTFQHTPVNEPAILTIEAVTVEDKAATFNLSGFNLANDPPTMRVQFELENGDKAAAVNGRLIHLSNNTPSETFTVTTTMIGSVGTAAIAHEMDEGDYTLVLDVLDENGRSLANDDAQFNYTIPDGNVGRASKALVNNPLLWLFFLIVLSIVALIVWNSGQQVGKKKGEASNVALNSPLAVAELVEDEVVAVQLTVTESPDSTLFSADGSGEVWQIDHFPFTIGRDGCDLVVANDQHVSRKHAQIILVEGDHFIEDLGSANGTFLNATKLTANEPISLSPERGERITIGKTTTLSFNES